MNDQSAGKPAGDRSPGERRDSKLSWIERLPLRTRLNELHDQRDQARSQRDSARRALKSARAEREAALEALAVARGQRDLALEQGRLEAERLRAEHESLLRQSVADLAAEVRQLRSLQATSDRRIRFLHRELITDIQALHQLMDRYSPQARLPSVAGWALSPTGLLTVVDLIETRNARSVVECGSGTSTLWIGYALKRLGRGRLIALEHLPAYADKTRALVAAHGLEEYVDVRLAPLAPRQTPRGEFSWYSFDPAELDVAVDVLLVDGPPAATGEHARYPALSVFRDRLAPDAVIVADDVDRRDEQEILEFWLKEEPRLERVDSPGVGIEVLHLSV